MIRACWVACVIPIVVAATGPLHAQDAPLSKDALFETPSAPADKAEPLSKDALFGTTAAPADKSAVKFRGMFDELGARTWALRAERESAAAGRRPAAGSTAGGLDRLTPQEREIARAIADGLSNAEAAATLFLSRKTVEAHLTRVYRKLGLRSRTELAREVARREQ